MPSDAPRDGIAHSLLRAGPLTRLLKARYPLGEPLDTRFWRGRFADVYRVESPSGPFALRILPTEAPCSFLEFQLEALRFLRFRKVGVAAPVAQRDGRLVLEIEAPEGPRAGVLYPWIEGHGLADRRGPESLARVGAELAKVHLKLDAWGPIEPPVPAWNRATLLDASMASLEQVLGAEHAALPSLEREGVEAIRALEGLPTESGVHGLVHGDPDPSNIRVGEDGITLIDFDHMGVAPRAWDLAVLRFEAEWNGWPGEDYSRIESGYERRRPLSDAERAAVRDLVPLRSIQALGLFARGAHRLGEEWLRVRHLERHLRFFESRRG